MDFFEEMEARIPKGKVRTRFAPSPTGYMHVGNLRTALYTWLIARRNHGTFILRIEDTDQGRLVDGAVDVIYKTLAECGLDHDEGPDVGGPVGPYVQSERRGLFGKYADLLVERGGAYYCFCQKSDEEPAEEGKEIKKHVCACRDLPLEEAKKRVAAGEPYVVRQRIPHEGSTTFHDASFGDITVENKEMEDQVLLKSDGLPTYNFANVVDDHLMGINYVIRGVEYLSSTPKYNLLYKAFGWEIPNYMHLQPIMRDATHKLSKRHGDASYEDFIKKGYLKEAIVNYIALLGWSPKDNREKFSLSEMAELFSVSGLSKSASIFDENKMRWLNSCYIKELTDDQFHKYALPFYEKLGYLAGYDLRFLSGLLKNRCEIFSDVGPLTEFLTRFDGYDLGLLVNAKWKTDCDTAKKMLPDLIGLCRDSFDSLHDGLVAYAEKSGFKKGQVLWIFRIAVTGAQNTPGGATEMAELLGREKTIARLTSTLERLQ